MGRGVINLPILLLSGLILITALVSCPSDILDQVEENVVVKLSPQVLSTVPADLSEGVEIITKIQAVFNQDMDQATVTNPTHVLVSDGTSALTGSLSYHGPTRTLTFTPATPLTEISDYTVTLKNRIKNSAGRTLTDHYYWRFSTGTSSAPAGSIKINNDADYTNKTAVTLNLTQNGYVDKMQFSFDNFATAETGWLTYSSTYSSLPLDNVQGAQTVYVQFVDLSGEEFSPVYYDTIILDSVAPGTPVVSGITPTGDSTPLWEWSPFAGDSDVTLYSYSLDSGGWVETAAASFEPASALPLGDHTLEVKAGDAAGNWSAVAGSHAITVEASAIDPPTVSAVTPTKDKTPTWSWSAVSGATTYRYKLDNSDLTSGATEKNVLSYTPASDLLDGKHTLYVQTGNGSVWSTSGYKTVLVDSTAPTVTTFLINKDEPYANSTAVTLIIDASDSGSGFQDMCFSNDQKTWSAWQKYTPDQAWTLSAGDGLKTVYARFRDAAGNVATSSDSITLDGTKPTVASFTINNGAAYTTSATVTLYNSVTDAGSGMSDMRFSNDLLTWSKWEAYAATYPWDLTAGDGAKTVYAQFRDAAGNVAETKDAITLDSTAPTSTFNINNNAAYTTTATVTLNNEATDAGSKVEDMCFSNDGSTWSKWEAYAATKAWTLTADDGAKTVYAQFRDTAGNVAAVKDAIILDSTAPTVTTFNINKDAVYTTSAAVTLVIDVSDSGSSMSEMRFSNDNVNWSLWQKYATTFAWTLSKGDGLKTVYAQFRDNYGYVTEDNDTIILDTAPPTVTSFTINKGATYTTSTAVTLYNDATDAGSGMSQMRYSNDSVTWSTWEAHAATKAWTLTAGDSSKAVYAQFRDAAGNVTETKDAITLDSTAPTITSFTVNNGATYTTSTAVTLYNDATDAGSGVSSMRFSNDGKTWPAVWQKYAATYPWDLAAGLDGLRTVYAQFRDTAGNVAETKDSITLDSTPPYPPNMLSVTISTKSSLTRPTWTWEANPKLPGNGTFEYVRVWVTAWSKGETKPQTITTLNYTPEPLADGEHTVYVRERDDAGNWSDWSKETSDVYGVAIIKTTGIDPLNGAPVLAAELYTVIWEVFAVNLGLKGAFFELYVSEAWEELELVGTAKTPKPIYSGYDAGYKGVPAPKGSVRYWRFTTDGGYLSPIFHFNITP